MASDHKGKAVVLMGPSGAGKSTIGQMLGKAINSCFLDADDYHSPSNKEKMQNGIPLTDEDRVPWLETLGDVLRASLTKGQLTVLACSALQKHYREVLRSADPSYEQGSRACSVKFFLLDATADVLADRLNKRAAEGKHFMPAKLLQSQLDLLQIDESEGVFKIDATLDPQDIVSKIHTSFHHLIISIGLPVSVIDPVLKRHHCCLLRYMQTVYHFLLDQLSDIQMQL